MSFVILATMGLGVPSAAAMPDPDPATFPPVLRPGDTGPWVAALQRGLREAGFRPGPVDGRFGSATVGAVHAFEKVHALPRNGSFGRLDWQLLEAEIELPPDLEEDRVEIDLGRQVLFLIEDQRVASVLSISSGNGKTYANQAGRQVRAFTPEGEFALYRRIQGWRTSYLGQLYEPFYFRGGYAIHGSPSVPPFPASHGCVRVHLADMDWLKQRLWLGMPVFVYGLATERPSRPIPEPPEPPALAF